GSGCRSLRTGLGTGSLRSRGLCTFGLGRSRLLLCLGLCICVSLDGSAKFTSHGRLNGRRRTLDEFAEFLQLCECELTVDAEFSGNLVYAWFGSHNSPVWVGLPRQGRPLVADGSHFEPFTFFP